MKILKKHHFICILLLFLVLPMSNLWLNMNLVSATSTPEQEIEETRFTSHSSPYFFHVNHSSPLLNSDEDRDGETNITMPKSSQYYYSPYDHALTLYMDKYAIIPGESIELNLKLTKSFLPVQDGLINVMIYKGFYRYYYYYYPGFYDAELIFSNQFYTDENGEVSFLFSDTSEMGTYTIFAYYDFYSSYTSTYREFSVSETGVFLKGSKYYVENQEYHASVHLVNISDFTTLSNQNYTYSIDTYSDSLDQWVTLYSGEKQTDIYGYDVFQTEPIIISEDDYIYYFWNALRLTIESEDGTSYSTFLYKDWTHYYYTLWGGQEESNYDSYQFIVTNDKTIYSPGETIKLRALVFQYSYLNETRTPCINQAVDLTIYNPSELVVYWTQIQTNSEGIAVIEFPLDYDSEIGTYGFEFSIKEISYLHSIRVDYYEKPVFRVTIDTNGKEFYPKTRGLQRLYKQELFEGFIKVEYYFGQPVIDADVTLTLLDYYESGVVYQVTGKTNGEGKFKFSIDLKWLEGIDWAFIAKGVVTDTYGRTTEISKRYTRMEDIFAYGYLTDWAPSPDEPLEYYFNVYQILSGNGDEYFYDYEYNPLANVPVEIKVYGIQEYPIYITTIRARTRLDTYTAVTNEYGAGKIEFSLPLEDIKAYDLFEIRLDVELEDERSTTWFTYYRYRKYRLNVQIQTSNINPGDTVELTATYLDALEGKTETGEGYIHIYDAEYNLLGQSYFEIEGSRDFQVTVPNFAPEGTYYLYSYVYSRSNDYYGGFYYHSIYKEFSVGTIHEIALTTNITTDSNYVIDVELGETIEITGTTNVSTTQPYYFEIYKRGLLHSERLNVIDDQFSKELRITSDLGPDFTVMVYTISNSGRLYETYFIVHVNFSSGFEIRTDKEVYEPGDTVTLSILPKDNSPMLISTTFIDSAVLAVEPEDDSELGYFERSSYNAYIGSGSSWGTGVYWENYAWISYEVPTGGLYYSPYYIRDLGYDIEAFAEGGGMNKIDLSEIVRTYNVDVRKNITESANWIPSKIISDLTNITFQLPDNIGEWTIRIVGNAMDESNILWGDVQTIEIKAYLPFFVEFEPPVNARQDEIVTLNAYVYNYADVNLITDVMIEAPGFDILNDPIQTVQVPYNFVSEIEFTLHARDPFLQNITILALSENGDTTYSDAKQMRTYIHPTGYELTERLSEYLNESIKSYLFNYTIDSGSIYHRETLAFYKDLIDISIEGWERLIGYPYGCVEQTTSKLIPTVLIYRYLNQTGQLTKDVINELTPMIMQGLSRLYSMQNQDGGWGWWSDYDSNILMTTLVVFTLQQVELTGFNVNSYVMFKAYSSVVYSQKSDGSWLYPYYSANPFESTIYTLRVLISAINKTTPMESAIQSGINFLNEDWLNIEHQSSYGAALYLITTMGSAYENSTFKSTMLSFLAAERQSTGDTIFWENDGSYYWSNLGNRVEITAYATLALAMDDFLGNYAIIQKAVKFLLDSKSTWGWWSTADSSAAIYTLSEIKRLSGSSPLLDFNGTVMITVNSATHPQVSLNLTDSIYSPSALLTEISDYLEIGENEINITISGTGQLAFVFDSSQLIRYMPVITMPVSVDVNNDHYFNITLDIDPYHSNLELADVTLSLLNLPEEFEGSNTLFLPSISAYTQINFTLQAPSNAAEYIFEGIFISLVLVVNNDSENGIPYYRSIGPIIVRVFEEEVPIGSAFTAILNPDIDFRIPSVTSTIDNEIILQKQISKSSNLLPGDLVTIILEINNSNSSLQYLALDDFIPTGMVLARESIRINGIYFEDNLLDMTLESSSSELHFFIPLLPTGTTRIRYSLLVSSVKSSVIPPAILWGMYENVTFASNPIVLMNLPILYNPDLSIYQDLSHPTIGDIFLTQIEGIDEVELSLSFEATDNNEIYKVRFIYQQGIAWRSQSLYYSTDLSNFNIVIEDLDNKDSKMHYFVEVQDEYGNLVSSNIHIIMVHSTIIPYLSIGIGIVLAVAAASVVATVYKKKARNGMIKGVSFTEESDESLNS